MMFLLLLMTIGNIRIIQTRAKTLKKGMKLNTITLRRKRIIASFCLDFEVESGLCGWESSFERPINNPTVVVSVNIGGTGFTRLGVDER